MHPLTKPVSGAPPPADDTGDGVIPRQPINWANTFVNAPAARQWAIDGWLGRGHVTLLAGPPGTGKTALAQTIVSCLVSKREVINPIPMTPMRCLFWAGEDDQAELERRGLAIAAWLKTDVLEFSGPLILQPYQDVDITLASTVHNNLYRTQAMDDLSAQIGDYKADVVVLDSLARVYGGNENDRHQVTLFMTWLSAAIKPTNAACLLLGHPSRTAGAEWSGSSAWEASCRSRWYFGPKLPDQKPDADDDEPDANVRWLAKRKTNYSDKDIRKVTWDQGCMQPDPPPHWQADRPSAVSVDFLADETLRIFRKLREMGEEASGSPQSQSYLPKMAKRLMLLDSLTERDIRTGLAMLMRANRLKVGNVGQYQNRTPRRGLVEP